MQCGSHGIIIGYAVSIRIVSAISNIYRSRSGKISWSGISSSYVWRSDLLADLQKYKPVIGNGMTIDDLDVTSAQVALLSLPCMCTPLRSQAA